MNIYFVFPYKGVGGVSLLFLRFAEYIGEAGWANCFLVDYSDGYMSSHVRVASVQIVHYADDDDLAHIPSGAIAVFQSMTPWSIFPALKIDDDVRVLFWNCYPFNLIPLLPGVRRQMQNSILLSKWILHTILIFHYTKIKKFIELLVNGNALVFMDKTNVQVTEDNLDLRFDSAKYVPVAINKSDRFTLEYSSLQKLNEDLRVVWLGRVVDFKFYSLAHALRSLNDLKSKLNRNITVTIVGCGAMENELKLHASSLSDLKINFIDHVDPSELDYFLLRTADLLLAMGTSALEGAKLGIPTILLDVSHAEVSKDYVFTWIYERDGYTLGELIDSGKFIPNNSSLEMLMFDLIYNYPKISKKTVDYFLCHHEIDQAAASLLDSLKSTTCTYGQLKRAGVLNRGFLYSMFLKFKKMRKLS